MNESYSLQVHSIHGRCHSFHYLKEIEDKHIDKGMHGLEFQYIHPRLPSALGISVMWLMTMTSTFWQRSISFYNAFVVFCIFPQISSSWSVPGILVSFRIASTVLALFPHATTYLIETMTTRPIRVLLLNFTNDLTCVQNWNHKISIQQASETLGWRNDKNTGEHRLLTLRQLPTYLPTSFESARSYH